MKKARFLVVLLLLSVFAFSVAQASLPQANALGCRIKVGQLEYPTSVDLSQKFNVNAHFSVTCSTSMVDLAGRVDLVEQDTNKTVSTSGFHLGYVSEPEKTFNVTVSNQAEAPSTDKDWTLKAYVTLFAVEAIIASANSSFVVHVGSPGRVLLWLPVLIVALAVVGILVYATRIRRKRRARK